MVTSMRRQHGDCATVLSSHARKAGLVVGPVFDRRFICLSPSTTSHGIPCSGSTDIVFYGDGQNRSATASIATHGIYGFQTQLCDRAFARRAFVVERFPRVPVRSLVYDRVGNPHGARHGRGGFAFTNSGTGLYDLISVQQSHVMHPPHFPQASRSLTTPGADHVNPRHHGSHQCVVLSDSRFPTRINHGADTYDAHFRKGQHDERSTEALNPFIKWNQGLVTKLSRLSSRRWPDHA